MTLCHWSASTLTLSSRRWLCLLSQQATLCPLSASNFCRHRPPYLNTQTGLFAVVTQRLTNLRQTLVTQRLRNIILNTNNWILSTINAGFCCRYLISQGANVGGVNSEGETPLDIAEEEAMEELLQNEINRQGTPILICLFSHLLRNKLQLIYAAA